MADSRIYPLLEVSRAELEALVDAPIAMIELLQGGFTNTLHRVALTHGDAVVVKHYASGASAYRDELAALTALSGKLPVPEVVRADESRRAIVYRWIAGSTLDDCRREQPAAAFASLADPLGRLFGWLARTDPIDATDRWDVGALVETARGQLADGRARSRMGDPLADALVRMFDAAGDRLAWGPRCLCHHDIGGRNILVQGVDERCEETGDWNPAGSAGRAGGRAPGIDERWRIGGVIDWEDAGTGSPLVDLGSLFRYPTRYTAVFRGEFEVGYREVGGTLPDDWYRTARLIDALRVIDTLDVVRELPGVFADCRMLLAKLAADLNAA